jgi:hypothetical protein
MFRVSQKVWSDVFRDGVVVAVEKYPFCTCVSVDFNGNRQVFNRDGIWLCPDAWDIDYIMSRTIYPK